MEQPDRAVVIRLAEHAGFCFGVKRAIRIAFDAASSRRRPVYSLGPIIHSPQVVAELEAHGVGVIDDLIEGTEGSLIIRSHGLDPKIVDRARDLGLEVIDATCPFVKRAQQLAHQLHSDGYRVVVVGEKTHPEVRGIVGYAGPNAYVVSSPEEARIITWDERIGVVAQTTIPKQYFGTVMAELVQRAPEVKAFDTICRATVLRQETSLALARSVDLMLVVGGRDSANTTRLYQMCRRENEQTFHIETADEIDENWIQEVGRIGVTAGASTPEWVIEDVIDRLTSGTGGYVESVEKPTAR